MGNEIQTQAATIQPTAAHRRTRKKNPTSSIPYAGASSGDKARVQTIKILHSIGCEQAGFMDDFEKQEVILYFKHRGRSVEIRASIKGYAQMYFRQHPRTRREDILRQGRIAVNSMLRDWVKGSVTAIESGILSFEAVFMPHMLTNDGRPVIERMRDVLPVPASEKVVSLPSPAATDKEEQDERRATLPELLSKA